jgi:hypothetical protein
MSLNKLIAFFLCRKTRLPLAFRGGLLLLIVVAVLHTLDRQGEFVSRTDFLWKAKLKVEQEEVETMRGINKVNIILHLCQTKQDTFRYNLFIHNGINVSIHIFFSSSLPVAEFFIFRSCSKIFCQLMLHSIFSKKSEFRKICITRVTLVLEFCLHRYRITRNSMTKPMLTSKVVRAKYLLI